MKIPMVCMECFKKDGRPSEELISVELKDSGLYEVCCLREHQSLVRIQNQKLEILFELGAMAYLDGYYREAVASFVAAVERFHEFCIKMFLQNKKISFDNFSETWKLLKFSERQLGGFYLLYLCEFNEPPPSFVKDHESFRNNVTHNGYVPSSQKAFDYGDKAFEYMKNTIQKIRSISTQKFCFGEILLKEVIQLHEKYSGNTSVATMSCPTIFSLDLAAQDFDKKTFSSGLEALKKYKTWMYKN